MYYIRHLYIFFSVLALIIFFFSTEAVKAKSFEINDIEITQQFEINFDKNEVIDLGFKKAFFELIYSLIKSSDFSKIDDIRLNEIKGMIEGTGRHQGKLGSFVIDYKGKEVRVGSGLNDETREQLWKEPEIHIGRIIEVRYQEETPDGSLRFPTFVCFRNDKS